MTETHALAKKKLLNFCYTSSTEMEETEKGRKKIKRKHYNSTSSDENPNNDSQKETLNTQLCNLLFLLFYDITYNQVNT